MSNFICSFDLVQYHHVCHSSLILIKKVPIDKETPYPESPNIITLRRTFFLEPPAAELAILILIRLAFTVYVDFEFEFNGGRDM